MKSKIRRIWILNTTILLFAGNGWLPAQTGASAPARAVGDASPYAAGIKEFVENFKPNHRAVVYGQERIYPPQEAVRMLETPAAYKVELAAHEPEIQQPLDLHFDHRGRLWVVHYRQFPHPAGLKIIEYDGNLRAKYDRTIPAPPHHFRGNDRITIHEDTNGDGAYDQHKDFITGLNMATSLELDYEGVWVLMAHYLLFYPDRNHDDIPDGDPEVHLAGFNFEDTHSPASSLHWGPDGWLYGAKGSTSTMDIQGIRLLGQGVWRYHPKTGKFEIFAEGGGNTVSLDFDKYGRAFSGTNNGNVRGPHYVQGATYNKTWPKHGPALNPFIFGFFPHMEHQGYAPRFAQSFHLYEGGAMAELEGCFIAGMAISSRVQPARLVPSSSTFRTVDIDPLIVSRDLSFRPVDVEGGPDGCIYIADWSDPRIGNLNPQDTWHKTSGRIYRITPANFVRPAQINVTKLATNDLYPLLAHANRWYREEARRELAIRPEAIEPRLKSIIAGNGEDALEALWVLNLRGELDSAFSVQALQHPNEHVRRWVVRLLGDRNHVDAPRAAALAALAEKESAPEVRSQLASSARRLPAGEAMPIVRKLLAHDLDAADKHIPLLLWWAIESKADTDRETVLAMLRDPAIWKSKIFAQHIAGRLGRRYTADQGPRKYYVLKHNAYTPWIIDRATAYFHRNLKTAGDLLALAPDDGSAEAVLAGMSEGLTGGLVESVPENLIQAMHRAWTGEVHSTRLTVLAARLGHRQAIKEVIDRLGKGGLNAADEKLLIDYVADTAPPAALPLLANLFGGQKNESGRERLLAALSKYPGADAAKIVMDHFSTLSRRLRMVANRMLSEKPAWARLMLERIGDRSFDPGVLSESNEKAIAEIDDPEIARLLNAYRKTRQDNPAEREALALFEKGRTVYSQLCSACHQPDGKGQNMVAPSLVASRWVHAGAEAISRIVLDGKQDAGRGLIMPPLKHLSDEEIAAVQIYVLREFASKTEQVTPRLVAQVRAATADRNRPWNDAELQQLFGGANVADDAADSDDDGGGRVRTIDIQATKAMKFSVERIDLDFRTKAILRLSNSSDVLKDQMACNLVLLKRTANPVEFATAAAAAHATNYLPPALADQVIASTKLLGPGESDSVIVDNLAPGDYVYLATFPGSFARGMKGILSIR
jgi:putative membrane-bound dehydrogenase-like protein